MGVLSPPFFYGCLFRIYSCSKSGLKARGQRGFHRGQAGVSGSWSWEAFGLCSLHRICHYMFCNQFFLHGIHTVTTLRHTSFNVPFSGVLTKKGDCIPLQHLQIVVVYLSANMEAQGNAFINSTSPKTTRRNSVHVAQLHGVGVKLLSFTNTSKKNLRDSWQRDNIKQKSWYCQQRCPPATCTPRLNHLKILLYRSLMGNQATRALWPVELIHVWHKARTPLPVWNTIHAG